MTRSNTVSPLQLQVGVPHDIVISAVLRKLAEHEPFRTYSLAIMVNAVMGQLQNAANIMGLRDGKLVAYAGWLRVHKADAEAWLSGQRDIPAPDWHNADAAISTIIIADDPADLRTLIRGVSNACANLPVYRMRVFGETEQKRKPITGRVQAGL
ncbi:MAG: hypothetical protein B0W54_06740 [Cellvibrio sp. 79]|nr:MAG: hypothetical protein B0W54_06740 [Cellvibrio sp. 79]